MVVIFPSDARLSSDPTSVVVLDGSVTLPHAKHARLYACSKVPWRSDFEISDLQTSLPIYARALLLVEVLEYLFVYCTYFVPLDFTRPTARDLSKVWHDSGLVTSLELPLFAEPAYCSEFLPLSSIQRPTLLLPMPQKDIYPEQHTPYRYWLHPYWADVLLPLCADMEAHGAKAAPAVVASFGLGQTVHRNLAVEHARGGTLPSATPADDAESVDAPSDVDEPDPHADLWK